MLNIKTLYAYFVCLIVLVLTNAQGQQTSPTQKLEEYFYRKCWDRTYNLTFYQKLYDDTLEFLNRMDKATQLIPDDKKTFCGTERKHLVTRIEQVAKDLKPCLPPNEEYLSDFVETAGKEALHFLCHNHGENMERLFSAQGKRCTASIEEDNSNELSNCFGKIFSPASSKYVTKRELCDNMNVAQKCFNIVLNKKCPQAQFMHELNEKFFKYVGKTCSGCITNYVSTLLLIVSIVLPFTLNLKN